MATTISVSKIILAADSVSVVFDKDLSSLPKSGKLFDFKILKANASTQSSLALGQAAWSSNSKSTLVFELSSGAIQDGDVVLLTFPPASLDPQAISSFKESFNHDPYPPQEFMARFSASKAQGKPQHDVPPGPGSTSGNGSTVPRDIGITADSFEDAITYPFLTEEVGMPPGPLGGGGAGGYGGGRGGSSGRNSLGQSASQAITDVLGWRVNSSDPSGFMGALSQSFSLTEVDGHVESKWMPRSYAVQTDLAGGITGAQASLLFRMKDAVDQSLPLLEGLTPLRRDPDWEYITAAKAVIKSQLTELVGELSMPGSLRVARVDQMFRILFEPPLARLSNELDSETAILEGQPVFPTPVVSAPAQLQIQGRFIEVDPDYVGGQVGELRSQLGLRTRFYHNPEGRNEVGNLVNTVDDETDQTNYRMMVDYLGSMWISWLNNRKFFELPIGKGVQPFFGTQLVLISRALSVVAEKVIELRFALDSVFIGQSERQALELRFTETIVLLDGVEETVPSQAMFLEDLLNWVYSFATDEGPRLIQTAGRYGVRDSFFPVAKSLHILVHSSKSANGGTVHGFKTARVRRAISELSKQLKFLTDMARPIHSPMPLPARQLPSGSF